MYNAIIYLISNFILTFYGLLVKSYPNISLLEQVYIRSIIFTLISAIGYNGITGFLEKIPSLLNITLKPITILLSLVNFISIYGIYISFEKLGIGITQAIFFSWPIFYYILTQKQYSIQELVVLLVTFLSVLLVLPTNGDFKMNKKVLVGLVGIFASLFTHIYVFYYMKINSPDINEYLYSQYIFVLIGLSIYYVYKKIKDNYTISIKKNIPIILFNLILGYLAFYLQFYSVNVLNPFLLSLLTFLSIIFGIATDMTVFGHHLEIKQLIGIIGIVCLNYFFYKP